ncbi:low molecular weight protein-tyrosine-phosphatase [Companilactobacillus metriopterae]|uniref:low molecular weight protein-tyrosine-phosphatase n=1 Tax=Companilactobacillus metriopterae TaxID=1909267 RepID=UPI00100BE998|nr:low molecular weight protein-tyrosine-phosphatase [Companilactobacillus metriopterae]
MTKIIYVCLGNICRSPMAEMIMKEMVANRGLEDSFDISSRATSTYEIGNPPHEGAIAELKRQSISIISHKAKQITEQDIDSADLVIGMDYQNIEDLKEISSAGNIDKIKLAYNMIGEDKIIEDPWYDHKFDRTYNQLSEIIPAIIEEYK